MSQQIKTTPLQATDLGGIYVPLITMKGHDLKFDEYKQKRFIAALIAAGVTGIVPNGTTGESATQSPEEHIHTTEVAYVAVNEVAKRPVQFIAGAGSNSFEEGKELVERIRESIGHGLTFLVVTPYYNKPTQKDLRIYYPHLASIVPDCTFILYAVKGRAGIPIEAETAIELSKHPQIIGMKDADEDPDKTELTIKGTYPNEFRVLTGADHRMLQTMTFYQKHKKGPGYGGIVASSNLAPAVWLSQYNAAIRGDMDEAKRIQREEIEPIKAAVFSETNPKPLNYVFDSRTRPPLYELDEKSKRQMDDIVEEFGDRLGIDIAEFNPRYA